MTSVARRGVTRAAAPDGAAAPRDGPGDKPIERPSGVRVAPARALIARDSAGAAELPLPNVLVGFGISDEMARTASFVRAADIGWSNGSARKPKPEVMRTRSSGM